MDESTMRSMTLALHILSIVIVLCTITACVALTLVSRALESWLPTLALALNRRKPERD